MSRPVVLITGAAGFAGSHLLEHLSDSVDVVAWARSEPVAELAPIARWQRVDLLDREQVNQAIEAVRPDAIVHCAGMPHVAESWADTTAPLAANVLGTHRIIEAVERLNTPCRIVVTSSAQVYGPSSEAIPEDHTLAPSSPYALSKLAQEQLALRSASARIEIIVARPFNHTGARQKPSFLAPSVARQIALIEKQRIPPVIKVGNLEPRRDIIDVRDAVRAYALLVNAGTPGTVYNVASGVGRPVRAIVEALVARAHVDIRLEHDAARLRPNDVPTLVGDSNRLHAATGWQPEVTFDRMLDDLLTYWRRHA